MQKMTLHAIIIGRHAKEPLDYVQRVNAVAGLGLEGDRYYYGEGTFNDLRLDQKVREVSIIDYKSLEACNRRLGSTFEFRDLRRNLVIQNLDIEVIGNNVFSIGAAEFKIVRTCPPCRYLGRLLDKDMMVGLKYIGGYRAVIVKSGMIQCGDELIVKEYK